MSLTGKVAIVTGAARGIGAGIALRLAQEGARVSPVSRPFRHRIWVIDSDYLGCYHLRHSLLGPQGSSAGFSDFRTRQLGDRNPS